MILASRPPVLAAARAPGPKIAVPKPINMNTHVIKVPNTRKNSGGEPNSPNGANQRNTQMVNPMNPNTHGTALPITLAMIRWGEGSCSINTPQCLA